MRWVGKRQLRRIMGKRTEQTFLQREHADGQWKGSSTSSIIREMLIKTTMRYHLMLQNGYHQKEHKLQMLVRMWRKGNLPALLVGMWIGTATMEKSMEVPQKTKIKQPYDPVISLLAIYLEENIIWKDTCTPVFIAALFTTAKTRKQPKCASTDEWIKMWRYMYIHTHWSISEP